MRTARDIGREKRRAYRDDIYWARPVPGFGDPRARLLIVGLAPAAHGANRTGRVFTGDGTGGSGDFLMAALHRAGFANMPTSQTIDDGLVLRDAYIAAAVRCAPPDNKPTAGRDRQLPAASRRRGRRAVLESASSSRSGGSRSTRICGCSKVASVALGPRPLFGHGSTHTLPDGLVLIGCYHPSRQNTNTGQADASDDGRRVPARTRIRVETVG